MYIVFEDSLVKEQYWTFLIMLVFYEACKIL